MFRKHSKRYQDTNIRHPVDDPHLKFSDYITQYKKILSQHRDFSNLPNTQIDKIIDANLPYELYPNKPLFSSTQPHKIKSGALLIHGLLDTPFIMKDIGTVLQKSGLLVRSIILPGHGTVPGNLLNTQLEDWIQAVNYGINALKNEVENIFLVGFSTGASLSLYHTLHDSTQIAGLIMLSPAFKINSYFDFLTNSHGLISWAWPRSKWLHVADEVDYTKYISVPLNAPYQVYRLTRAIKKIDHTREVPCPIFIALSNEDRIVSSKVTIDYFRSWQNPNYRMVLYTAKEQRLNDPRIIQRGSVYPDWHIKNFSHVSIPISPNNPHYGIHGDCPLASHVEENNNCVYGALDKPSKIFYNLLYRLKLVNYNFQRLTFNPDFDFMMQQIKDFIFSGIKSQ